MATPDITVEIGFNLGAIPGPTTFVLSDPVKGELDSSFVLGGELFYDVTDKVRSVSVRRGRSRRLDKSQTGYASVILDNRDRTFDPLYSGSPYAGQIKPRRPIRIGVSGQPVFTGLIEDWNLDYDVSGDSLASTACVDGFVLLAGAELEGFTATEQTSGERVAAILDRTEVAWPAGSRDIEVGSQQLQGDTVDANTNVLNYLQLVEESEAGSLFIGADGVLTFKGANTPPAAIVDPILTDGSPVAVDYDDLTIAYSASAVKYVGLDDDDIAVAYLGIAVEYGTEALFNRVIVSRLGGTAVAVDDLDSQAEYGVSVLDRSGLLSATDGQVDLIADFLLSKYAEPQVRIREVTVDLGTIDAVPQMVGLEIGDLIRVRYTPNQIGEQISQIAIVEGLAHSVSPQRHLMTFALDRITTIPFELDSDDFGVLDESTLGL
jgi:hypothetical protein